MIRISNYRTWLLVMLSACSVVSAGEKDGSEKSKVSLLPAGFAVAATGLASWLVLRTKFLSKKEQLPQKTEPVPSWCHEKTVPALGHMPRAPRTSETIFFEKGAFTEWFRIPTTIEDAGWRILFSHESTEKLQGQLEKLIHSYLEQPVRYRDPREFLRAGMRLLAPYVRPFERQRISAPDMSYQGIGCLEFCSCCDAGRYHISQTAGNYESCFALSKSRNTISSSIRVPSNRYLLFQLITPAMCMRALMCCAHEMGHIAGLDYFKGNQLMDGEFYAQELACDMFALCAVSGNDAFSALIERFMGDVVKEWLQVKSKLHTLPSVSDELLVEALLQFRGDKEHPTHCVRIENIMTAWAAYLFHKEKIAKYAAVESVLHDARKLYRMSLGNIDLTCKSSYRILDLVFNTLFDAWHERHKAPEPLIL